VIHVAFNKKAGRAPLKELLHNDSVLRNRLGAEVMAHHYSRAGKSRDAAKREAGS
jgi:hypothetical protein